jgi:hypothetical protein
MTARKTTPHLRRGPKPKPKPPRLVKRGVGRPEVPLSAKPYRHLLVFCERLVAMGLSRRTAAVYMEAMYRGPITTKVVEHKPRASSPPRYGLVMQVALQELRDPGDFDLEDFAKDCDALRALWKWHAARPADLVWLRTMTEALNIASGPWHLDASDNVLRLAASANETEWAQRVLLPMLREKEPASRVPELADNFSPT